MWNCFLNFLSDCALLVNGNITNVCVDLVTCKFMELFSFLLRPLGFSYRVASFVNGDGFTSALVPASRCRQNLCSAARPAGRAGALALLAVSGQALSFTVWCEVGCGFFMDTVMLRKFLSS